MSTNDSTNTTTTAIPSKCTACEALQQVPFSCEDCHELLAHVQGADYFELFGVPRRYDLDLADLEAKYLTISRNIHPDKYAVAGPEMQAFALRASASVNNAFGVLRDPIHRAEYLLESVGGPSAPQQKQVPPDLLGEVMMLREEIEAAQAVDDAATLTRIRRQLDERRAAVQAKIGELCGDLPNASAGAKQELRMQLNAMKYLNKVVARL